jgi:hypothetical protein
MVRFAGNAAEADICAREMMVPGVRPDALFMMSDEIVMGAIRQFCARVCIFLKIVPLFASAMALFPDATIPVFLICTTTVPVLAGRQHYA